MEYSLPVPQLGQLALLSLSCGPILILLSAMILGNAVSYLSCNSSQHKSLTHGVSLPTCYPTTHWHMEHTLCLSTQRISNSRWLNPISYGDELVNGSVLDCWLHDAHYLVTECWLRVIGCRLAISTILLPTSSRSTNSAMLSNHWLTQWAYIG